MRDFIYIAHRGASGSWPENTLLAFEKALDVGTEWIELDVHLSADGELVVIHDFTLDRTTDGFGKVTDHLLEELRNLDAGMGEKIPLLTEVLELAAGRATVNIELKGAGTGVAVARLLRRRETEKKSILASSLNEKELRNLSAILPQVPLAIVADKLERQIWQLAKELELWSLNLHQACIDQALVDKVKAKNLKLLAFTVNDSQQLEQLKAWGVDGVFTDFPERFAPI